MISSRSELSLEHGERGYICVWLGANDHINGRNPLQYVQADKFPKSSFQAIPLHDGASMLRNNKAYAGMMQKGSDHPELEMLSPNPLPIPQHNT